MEPKDIIVKWAQKGAELGGCGRMCDGCAFKKGTEANSDEVTTGRAAEILAYEQGVFYCHEFTIRCAG